MSFLYSAPPRETLPPPPSVGAPIGAPVDASLPVLGIFGDDIKLPVAASFFERDFFGQDTRTIYPFEHTVDGVRYTVVKGDIDNPEQQLDAAWLFWRPYTKHQFSYPRDNPKTYTLGMTYGQLLGMALELSGRGIMLSKVYFAAKNPRNPNATAWQFFDITETVEADINNQNADVVDMLEVRLGNPV